MPSTNGSGFDSKNLDKLSKDAAKDTAKDAPSLDGANEFPSLASFEAAEPSAEERAAASGLRGKVAELRTKASKTFDKATETLDSAKAQLETRFDSAQQWMKKIGTDQPMMLAGVALGAGLVVGVGAGLLLSRIVRA